MIQNESEVVVTDNSGAKKAKVIRVLKGSNGKNASIGDKVKVAIKVASPTGSIKKGDVAMGIVVRTRKEIGRDDGTYIRFNDNAIVLLTKNDKGVISPIGKRVFGPVAREIKKIDKTITNMSEEVV